LSAAPWSACAKHRFGGKFCGAELRAGMLTPEHFAPRAGINPQPPLEIMDRSCVIHLVLFSPKAVLRTRTPRRFAQGGLPFTKILTEQCRTHHETCQYRSWVPIPHTCARRNRVLPQGTGFDISVYSIEPCTIDCQQLRFLSKLQAEGLGQVSLGQRPGRAVRKH
jgi:hypothetical protein